MPDSFANLLDAAFLHTLENLRLAARHPVIGRDGGGRRSVRRGASLEFADFREYLPGDDLRYVDWKAYGRLEKLFLKQFQAEEDVRLHLLLDTSRSMAFGVPVSKLDCAKRLAAALGYLALSGSDRVSAASLDVGARNTFPAVRGRSGVLPLLRFLERMDTSEGAMPLSHALSRNGAQREGGGFIVVLSDFFQEAFLPELNALAARGNQVLLLHILAPEETDPALGGEARLLDSETGEMHGVSLSPYVLAQYWAQLEAFCAELRHQATRWGFTYARIVSDAPLQETVFGLRKQGVVVR